MRRKALIKGEEPKAPVAIATSKLVARSICPLSPAPSTQSRSTPSSPAPYDCPTNSPARDMYDLNNGNVFEPRMAHWQSRFSNACAQQQPPAHGYHHPAGAVLYDPALIARYFALPAVGSFVGEEQSFYPPLYWDMALAATYASVTARANCCYEQCYSPPPDHLYDDHQYSPVEYVPLRNDPLWSSEVGGEFREPENVTPLQRLPPGYDLFFDDAGLPSARLSPEEVDGSMPYTLDIADDGTPLPSQQLLESLFVPLAAGLEEGFKDSTAGNMVAHSGPADARIEASQQYIIDHASPAPSSVLPTISTPGVGTAQLGSDADAEGSEDSSPSATLVPTKPEHELLTESYTTANLPWQSPQDQLAGLDDRRAGFRLSTSVYLSDSSLCSPDSMSADSDSDVPTPPVLPPPPPRPPAPKSASSPTCEDKVVATVKSVLTVDWNAATGDILGRAVSELAAVLNLYGLDVRQIDKDILSGVDAKLAARATAAAEYDGPSKDDSRANSSGSEYGPSSRRSSARLKARSTRRATKKKFKTAATTTATPPRRPRLSSGSFSTSATPSSKSPSLTSSPTIIPSLGLSTAAKQIDTPTPRKIQGRKATYSPFFDDSSEDEVAINSPCASKGTKRKSGSPSSKPIEKKDKRKRTRASA
ncbi:hypothetical protein BDZ88DRAFT_437377 [Geranomyces variabilis]|nr:hypothetical protein BDZ88DRAFT_437377 [Geranomyces variabilis]KAJ3135698.1 hypothetical protein HDU90_003773 [Geranomyces variabilis]